MFESSAAAGDQITTLLDVLRGLGGGSYACLLDHQGVQFEAEAEDCEGAALRSYIEARTAALFRLPQRLARAEGAAGDAGDGAFEDLFADWPRQEGFFVAFINGRVAALVACPDPEGLQAQALKPLRALAGRVFAWRPSARSDGGPLSLFANRPRLDLVVVGPPESD